MRNDEEIFDGYGPYDGPFRKGIKKWGEYFTPVPFVKREKQSYDFLRDYSGVYNLYTANTAQPNPFSNKAMFIVDALSKMKVKFSLDIFTFEGQKIVWGLHDTTSHKLVNIIAEPNPEATGPAIVFVAHHDVANVHSQNCQDNGASVCNLLKLTELISKAQSESKRTIILFSDSEESGARGAKRFAAQSVKHKENKTIQHDTYGEIEAVINLELTGKGEVIWSDCEATTSEIILHESLETVLGKTILKLKTPPSDAIPFRRFGYPVLCIGTLPENDLKDKQTWRLCHSIKDTIDGCDSKNMEDFTTFLFNLTKTKPEPNDGINDGVNQAQRSM